MLLDTEPSSSESSKEDTLPPKQVPVNKDDKVKKINTNEASELWQEVARRRNKNQEETKKKNKEARDKIKVEREELDFQFDEELEVPMGKINTFSSDW